MSELSNQLQARKQRLQRFAEAAARHLSKVAVIDDIRQATALECCVELQAEKAVRRDYETANNQPIHAPVTWRILRAVSEEFKMPVSDIVGRDRKPQYTLPRYVAMGLMLQLTNMSLPAIGRRLGGRDHTTVLHGRNRLNRLLESESFSNRFEQIKAGVGA